MTETTPLHNFAYEFSQDPGDLQGGQIHRAILAVISEIPPVSKDGTLTLGSNTIPFQKYDDILDALSPVLLKHGIVTYPEVRQHRTELQVASEPMTMAQQDKETGLISAAGREIRDGKIPTTRAWAYVEYGLRMVFVGDNSEVTPSAVGESYDTNSDKATAKATTAALKRILTVTFKITDRSEGKLEEVDPDAGNRAATTDRREGGDRGQQQRTAAQADQANGSTRRSGPQRGGRPAAEPVEAPEQPSDEAVASADAATGEVPDEPQAPTETDLDKAKTRIRKANEILKLSPAEVDAIAAEATGKTTRADWINKITFVKKVADALEAKVAENA